MCIDAKIIKNKLMKAPTLQKDNVAQKIIEQSSPTDIKGFNVECILRLVEALTESPRIYSSLDGKAMAKLKDYSQYQPFNNSIKYAVSLIKSHSLSSAIIQSQLNMKLVKGIYAAEKKGLVF